MKTSKNVYDDLLKRDIHLTNVFDVYSSYDSPFKLKSDEMIFTLDGILHEGFELVMMEGPYRSLTRDKLYFNVEFTMSGVHRASKKYKLIHIILDCEISSLADLTEFVTTGIFHLVSREDIEKFIQNIDVISTFNTL